MSLWMYQELRRQYWTYPYCGLDDVTLPTEDSIDQYTLICTYLVDAGVKYSEKDTVNPRVIIKCHEVNLVQCPRHHNDYLRNQLISFMTLPEPGLEPGSPAEDPPGI